ncbi:hypothetical protein [Nonomuraea sp. NPDC046570]|uniref:helix-turn-helix transcriptional regulator n=1 Tax=Nonomuraea sp. NPDC046570 TaxID=3155255 RepID=UPI0033EE4AFD
MEEVEPILPELDEVSSLAYACALTYDVFCDEDIARELGLDIAQISRIRDTLVRLRLLTSTGEGQPLVPIDPQVAEAQISMPIEREILRNQMIISRAREQLSALTPIYHNHTRSQTPGQTVTEIDTARDVDRELEAAVRRCGNEILTMQPGGGRPSEILKHVFTRDLNALKRGVSMKVLYQNTARSNLATRKYVCEISQAGAEFRTVAEIFDRLIIIDRKTAFVPKESEQGRPSGAAVVTDPTVVGFMYRLFDSLWTSAQPFDMERTNYEDVLEDFQTTTLWLMSLGIKDEAVARRLGMSTRTCRRHISAIMDILGATSRFQAGVRASQYGLIPKEHMENDASAARLDP